MAKPTIFVRVFASHPVAETHYRRVLAAEKDFRLVSTEQVFQVGIFDGEAVSVEPLLSITRLRVPFMRPLVLCGPCDGNESIRWLFRGAWGVVTYDRYEEDLACAVRQLAEGLLWFPPSVVARWKQMDGAHRASAHHLSLTHREREVLVFLVRRLSNKEIASILKISEPTVKFHVGNILKKLDVSSRHELSVQLIAHQPVT